MTRTLAGRTLFITGASRGIGRAIALRAARDGANVAIVAKSSKPHPTLPGTVFSVKDEVEAMGGRGLACVADIRSEEQVVAAVEETVATFGGIDILVNNASAISLTATQETEMKRFDLMHSVNTRGTFLSTKLCLPYLKASPDAHVLMLSPPLSLQPRWFAPHLAYTLSKYGMSLCTLGFSEELRAASIAVNSLWPKTLIATSAVTHLLGDDAARFARSPDIMADASHYVLTRSAHELSGQFLIDEDVLRSSGVSDFSMYSMDPSVEPRIDLFVP